MSKNETKVEYKILFDCPESKVEKHKKSKMAGNPRKFSEKIAMHTQRQAEETQEFEKIMAQVSEVSRSNQVENQNRNVNKFFN